MAYAQVHYHWPDGSGITVTVGCDHAGYPDLLDELRARAADLYSEVTSPAQD